jgi:hypothetical protein
VRIDRQAPQAAAVFRVVEGLAVVQAHDAADHRAAVFVLGQPVHRAAEVARVSSRVDRQHAARLVQRLMPASPLRSAHGECESRETPAGRTVIGEPQAQGVGRIEEQLLRFQGQHLLRRGHVQGDIALAGLLVEQFLGQAGRVGKGVADQQPAPAAMHGAGLAPGSLPSSARRACRRSYDGVWPRNRRWL